MCEIQEKCGFYIYLRSTNRIAAGLDCPKENPLNCPRFKVKSGQVPMKLAQKIYGTSGNIYKHELPISMEESSM